jgi:hypothetical protein
MVRTLPDRYPSTQPGFTGIGVTSAVSRNSWLSERRSSSFLRIAITLQTLTILLHAVSAGLLVTSSDGETLHSVEARVMHGAPMLYLPVC